MLLRYAALVSEVEKDCFASAVQMNCFSFVIVVKLTKVTRFLFSKIFFKFLFFPNGVLCLFFLLSIDPFLLQVTDEEKQKVYSTQVDVVMSSDENSPSSLPELSDSSCRREGDLPGVKIHTASVNTVRDANETVRNIGSTNILGDSLGECTLAVVDGVVKGTKACQNLFPFLFFSAALYPVTFLSPLCVHSLLSSMRLW